MLDMLLSVDISLARLMTCHEGIPLLFVEITPGQVMKANPAAQPLTPEVLQSVTV